LSSDFPGSAHVRDVGLARAEDAVVWEYAAKNGYVIASKDTDFRQRALLFGHPPKVIWIRLGNCQTATILAVLRSHHSRLLAFEADPMAAFIAIG
jgi:predicted nuclease of predicted toxin-antitoxin system